MISWLLVLIATGSSLGAVSTADEAAEASIAEFAHILKAPFLLRFRVAGFVMAANIRPGMTNEETDAIMGKLLIDEGQFFPTGGWFGLRHYGFSMSYRRDKDGTWRFYDVVISLRASGSRYSERYRLFMRNPTR